MCTNPSWENEGYLLWDAASLIPGVPGSYVAKVPAKTAKVSKVGKGTRAASKSLRTASKAKRAKVLYKNKKYIRNENRGEGFITFKERKFW